MEVWSLDTQPIIHTFETLINVGAAVAAMVAAFFVMLAGYQYMTAGGSVRALEAAKSSLSNALIGLAIVVLCRVVANLVRGALGGGGGEEQSLGQVGVFAIAMLHSIG
jgi:Type IV secretion system pilin